MSKPIEAMTRRDFLRVAGTAGAALAAGAAGLGASAEAAEGQPAAAAAPDRDTGRKIRIGVVGGGFGAAFQWHLDPNCIVAAVSDLRPDRRAYLQQVYGCEKAYESLEILVTDPTLEAVAVFTGAPDHVRHVLNVFAHGKHAISAVPACLSLEDAHALKEAKERTGLKYMMAETSYYHTETMLARRLWEDKVFGNFVYTECEYYHNMEGAEREGLWFWNGKHTWRYGYPPMLYPTHSTCFHVGVTRERLTSVSCQGWGSDDEPGLKDNVYHNPYLNMTALFTTSGRNFCRANVFWRVHAGGERAQWIGERASMYAPGCGGQPFILQVQGQPDVTAMPDYLGLLPEPMRIPTGHGNSHGFLTHEFITALVEDREPAVNLYEALAITVPGVVAMESARRDGERMKVPGFDRA
jgi:predicted dehydrogenase